MNAGTNAGSSKQVYGFTLLEILVSISIIAFLLVIISQSFITTTKSNTKTELLNNIKQNGDYAMEVITRLIRSAKGVPDSYACDGTTPQRTLVVTDLDDKTITFGGRRRVFGSRFVEVKHEENLIKSSQAEDNA